MGGGVPLSPEAWLFDLPGISDGRTQKVFVFREVISPEFGVLKISSPIANIGDIDSGAVIRVHGQLLVGGLGYSPLFDDAGNPVDGMLCLVDTVPLETLALGDPSPFLLYLFLIARAADDLEVKLSSLGTADAF
jgi:hypothetical protein